MTRIAVVVWVGVLGVVGFNVQFSILAAAAIAALVNAYPRKDAVR